MTFTLVITGLVFSPVLAWLACGILADRAADAEWRDADAAWRASGGGLPPPASPAVRHYYRRSAR